MGPGSSVNWERTSQVSSGSVWSYVLARDVGMAPCVQDGMWTLGLCKPRVRASAQVGDYVVAIWTTSLHGSASYVHSVAKIDRADSLVAYYGRGGLPRRDQIYKVDGGVIRHRGDVIYHNSGTLAGEQQRKDKQGKVLVSEHFATFRASNPPSILDYEHLREITHSGIGQRKDALTTEVVADLERLIGRGSSGQ